MPILAGADASTNCYLESFSLSTIKVNSCGPSMDAEKNFASTCQFVVNEDQVPLVMDANCKTEGRMVVRLRLHVERASLVSNQYQLVRCLKLSLKQTYKSKQSWLVDQQTLKWTPPVGEISFFTTQTKTGNCVIGRIFTSWELWSWPAARVEYYSCVF
jgi:hypothetical protein